MTDLFFCRARRDRSLRSILIDKILKEDPINSIVAVFNMTDNLDKFLPGIEEYLETADNKKSVSSRGLEEMIYQIQIKTGLDQSTSKILVEMFFQEIRNSILRGEMVTIRNLGKFFISSPNSSNNKRRVFPTFKPYKKLIDNLNDC